MKLVDSPWILALPIGAGLAVSLSFAFFVFKWGKGGNS